MILVTGSRGLLGSACVRRLPKPILTYNGNLFHTTLFREYLEEHRPDAIVHCAAKVGGVKANRDFPLDFLSDNLDIQNTVINSAGAVGIEKLIFVSTSCLYPRFAATPVSEDALLTGPFESSVQSYAIAKLAGYELCRAWNHQYGKNFMTCAPSNIFGPNDSYGESAHVVPSLIKKISESLKSGNPVKIWGDGSAVREFIFSDDVALAIGVILEKWNKPDIINVGTGVGTSIRELADMLIEISGGDIRVEWDTSQPTGIQKKTFDISRLSRLGWSPKTKLRDGLKIAWDDFHNNPNPRMK